MKNSNVINDFSNQMSTLYSQEWIVQCFTSPPTQYRLYGRRFLQVTRPNQQYQSTEGKSTKEQSKQRKQLKTQMERQ